MRVRRSTGLWGIALTLALSALTSVHAALTVG